VVDDGTPRYAGTFELYVSDDACGIFEFDFVESGSYLIGVEPLDTLIHPILEPLLVTANPCIPQLLDCNPPNWTIDARIPHDPSDATVLLNDDIIELTFNIVPDALTPNDFYLSFAGCPDPCALEGITTSGTTAMLKFPDRLPVSFWTEVYHLESRRRCRVGSLPADADGNGTSDTDDINRLIANLRHAYWRSLILEECDIDRSFLCAPADLLMAVDLLNGSGAFTPWKGQSIDRP
jgi:hypothetical protein